MGRADGEEDVVSGSWAPLHLSGSSWVVTLKYQLG